MYLDCLQFLKPQILKMIKKLEHTGSVMKLDPPDIKKTIKRGIILYVMLAMVAIPSGICSHQTRLPDFKIPVLSRQTIAFYIPKHEDMVIPDIEAPADNQEVVAEETDAEIADVEELPAFS